MSTEEPNVQTINLLDRSYRISCGEGEQEALLQSAEYLDSKLRELQEGGRIVGLESVAIMTALNITHELIALRDNPSTKKTENSQNKNGEKLDKQLKFLQTKLEKALERNRLTV